MAGKTLGEVVASQQADSAPAEEFTNRQGKTLPGYTPVSPHDYAAQDKKYLYEQPDEEFQLEEEDPELELPEEEPQQDVPEEEQQIFRDQILVRASFDGLQKGRGALPRRFCGS